MAHAWKSGSKASGIPNVAPEVGLALSDANSRASWPLLVELAPLVWETLGAGSGAHSTAQLWLGPRLSLVATTGWPNRTRRRGAGYSPAGVLLASEKELRLSFPDAIQVLVGSNEQLAIRRGQGGLHVFGHVVAGDQLELWARSQYEDFTTRVAHVQPISRQQD